MMIQTLAGGVVARAVRRVPVRLAALAAAAVGATHATALAQPREAGPLFPMHPPAATHFAPAAVDGGPWTLLKSAPDDVLAGPAYIRPALYQAVHLDRAAMSALLRTSAREVEGTAVLQTPGAVKVTLPMPDGTFETFIVVESPVMEQELAEAYPEIKTYLGQGVTNPAATVRMHDTPLGFGAQVMMPDGVVCIDLLSSASDEHFASYRVANLGRAHRFTCLTAGEDALTALAANGGGGAGAAMVARSGGSVKRFRLAVAATGEYTQCYGGGSVPAALAAIVSTVNRVVQVYEQEVSVRLVLVANNDALVFPDAATDPYPDHATAADLLSLNTGVINGRIGSTAYDVGHVFSCKPPEGVARISSVCSTFKGNGVSFMNAASPVDPTLVQVVAHEFGHQFGANHSFNGNQGGCAGNRFAARAFEPGSGSTIMAYSGLCAGDNLDGPTTNADLYFHSGSFDEIIAVLPQLTCGLGQATGNRAPVVQPLPSYVTPANAALRFKGAATDPDGDTLTYSFENRDLGDAGPPDVDDGEGPLFRSLPATLSNIRWYPSLGTILGTSAPLIGEPIPTEERFFNPLNYRLTVRDNRAGNGAVNTTDGALQLVDFDAAFTVTTPANGANITTATTNVAWLVANTDLAIFGATRVRIRLSADDGQTFPYTLIADTANDGAQVVTLPTILSTNVRIKVEPLANVFFDIGPRFNVTPPGSPLFGFTGVFQIDDAPSNGNANGLIDPGESNVGLRLQIRKRVAAAATNVNATLVSLTPTVTVVQNSSFYDDPSTGAVNDVGNVNPVFNTTPYIISVSPTHQCGAPINLRLDITSSAGSINIPITLPSGDPDFISEAVGPFTYSYRGAPVNIRDAVGANTFPAQAAITVPDDITVVQLRVRMDGTRCTSLLGSTTVGLEHSSIGHLLAEIQGPLGNSTVLFNSPGGVLNRGNNMCQTVFTDTALVPNISNGTYPFPDAIPTMVIAAAPYSGTFGPDEDFSPFVGFTAQGTWTLRITDQVPRASPFEPADRGNIRGWSLIVYGRKNQVCQAPAASGLGARAAMLTHGRPNVLWPEPEPFTAADAADFLMQWLAENPSADIAAVGGDVGVGDGALTVDDLLAFMNAMNTGR